ncbi:alkaline phosphatase [Massilia sp. PAMC28688]|uniref:alkaline phosphatase n=1 Tax=Massilia sp. PAMC28688 TaxID=2861283 RepID=UPI001C63A296|nr:alkaline phosphatase [Massilia sp. PAMC28688]QYF91587.1 alkaline phosphatase [Massilia sp. PAMC28688]
MKLTPLCALLMAALCNAAAAAPAAKNVIFFLGDGMGATTLTAARIFKYKEEGLLHMESLERSARVKTYSNNAQTTDSAPSMGAYMTGIKINNDVISMADARPVAPARDANGNPSIDQCGAGNGRAAPTLLELAKARGKAVGAVTTTEMTHATPASTFAHSCDRDAGYSIAAQIVPGGAGYNPALRDGVDVLMGGGRHHFTPFDRVRNPTGRGDGRDLLGELAAQGYAVAHTRSQMLAAQPGRKFVGIYSDSSHLDYDIERRAEQPSLSEMALKAVDLLAPDPDGFFLMVEGGKIDHALHDSNASRALSETIAFDDAIKAVIERMKVLDPGLRNTLIVITADHDHAISMNGYGKRGNPILDIVRNYTDGQPARDADGKTFTTLVFGNGPNRLAQRVDVDSKAALQRDYHQESGVRLKGETHGGGDVKLFATGAGSQVFKGTMENTKVFHLMKQAFGF